MWLNLSRGVQPRIQLMADHAGIAKPHVAQTLKVAVSELLSFVKVQVDVLGFQIPVSPYGICGRKGTLKKK